jgi:hypothetical protein
MFDVKKLVTGFLVLALGTSASAWLLSSGATFFQNASPVAEISTSSPAPSLNNAFTENDSEPQDVEALFNGELPSSTEVALNDPNNLTAAVGNSLLDGLVSANPDGIQTDDNGVGQINQPDNQAIIAELSQNPAGQNIQIPNWNAEVVKDEASIKISSKPSSQDIINYLNSFNEVNDKYFLQTGLAQTAAASPSTDDSNSILDPSTIIDSSPDISGALAAALQMNIPAPFATFQKSWIKLLVYEKNTASLFSSISTDPARSALALNVEENNYNAAVSNFDAAREGVLGENIVSMGDNSSEQSLIATLIDKIFSIQSADAQVGTAACATAATAAATAAAGGAAGGAGAGGAAGAAAAILSVPVTDPVGTAAIVSAITSNTAAHTAAITASCSAVNEMSWGTYLLDLAKNVALQILKNTLLAQLQSHILKWIQGSGAPMFVQNWADDFANAGLMSATNWINGNFSCLGGAANLPRIQVTLNALYKPGNNACASQFQSQLSSQNLTSLYKNFMNGGFLSFSQSLMPSNDFYGGLWFTAQGAGQSAQQSKGLFSIKTTSQQGMKGGETCSDNPNDNPNGSFCLNESTGDVSYSKPCPSGYTQIANNGVCEDGTTPTTQAPALLTGQALGSGVTMGGKEILSANDVGGIVAALANSLISAITSSIVKTASSAINGAFSNSPNSTSLMSISADNLASPSGTSTGGFSGSSTGTGNSALICSPGNATASTGNPTGFSASGGFDANGDIPNYNWSSSDGQTASGPMFSPVYSTAGTYTITLGDSNNDPSATCSVTVSSSTAATGVSCSPATQTVTFDSLSGLSSITVSASGGAGSNPAYTWSAPGSVSTVISNPGFQASYNSPGIFNIFVTDPTDNSTSSCTVILQ